MDARGLRRNALNELGENMTALHILEVEIWEREKSWNSEKSNKNSVMNEEFVKNSAMSDKVVKSTVMKAEIDPKVVMDLSIFKLGGWNNSMPSNPTLLAEFVGENELWLLIRIPNRDPFFVTQDLEQHSANADQHMKKLMSFRGGLHVMMQCHMRQHFADRYWLHVHPGGHAS